MFPLQKHNTIKRLSLKGTAPRLNCLMSPFPMTSILTANNAGGKERKTAADASFWHLSVKVTADSIDNNMDGDVCIPFTRSVLGASMQAWELHNHQNGWLIPLLSFSFLNNEIKSWECKPGPHTHAHTHTGQKVLVCESDREKWKAGHVFVRPYPTEGQFWPLLSQSLSFRT